MIEDPIRGAVLNGDATIMLIPQPIRYALHKLIVSQERDVAAGAKRQKDLWQAFQLLELFVAEHPLDVEPSWNALVYRGPGWKEKAAAGLADMQRCFGTIDFTGHGTRIAAVSAKNSLLKSMGAVSLILSRITIGTTCPEKIRKIAPSLTKH